jgi:hypothetical protein
MLERSKSFEDWTDNTYSKHKESAHVSLVVHLIGHPCLDISHIWTPIIEKEVRKSQLCPV